MYWCANLDISGFNCLSWSFIIHYAICMKYWFQKHCLHCSVPLSILLALIDFQFHSVFVWFNIQIVLELHAFFANTRIHVAPRKLKKQLYKERYFIKLFFEFSRRHVYACVSKESMKFQNDLYVKSDKNRMELKVNQSEEDRKWDWAM
jgi:hypothetical protein